MSLASKLHLPGNVRMSRVKCNIDTCLRQCNDLLRLSSSVSAPGTNRYILQHSDTFCPATTVFNQLIDCRHTCFHHDNHLIGGPDCQLPEKSSKSAAGYTNDSFIVQ